MRLDEVVVARSRWHLAALGMELKLLRLGLFLRAYNPNHRAYQLANPMAVSGPMMGFTRV